MTRYRHIQGGLLAQSADDAEVKANDLKVVTKKAPTKKQIDDLLFAWKVVKHTKSNAIVLAKDGATVGIGMGLVCFNTQAKGSLKASSSSKQASRSL